MFYISGVLCYRIVLFYTFTKIMKVSTKTETPSLVLPKADGAFAEHLKRLNNGKPVIGPGSGRGRKQGLVRRLLEKEAERLKGESNFPTLQT